MGSKGVNPGEEHDFKNIMELLDHVNASKRIFRT